MLPDAILLSDTPRRFAFAADMRWLGTMIPYGAIGVYMLLIGEQPFYVGRSDHCVLTRLRGHPWFTEASHVVWEPCASRELAFHQEAAWYHILSAAGSLRNRLHPARPADHLENCPFCDARDKEALQYVLPHLRKQSVVTASPTASAVNAKTH